MCRHASSTPTAGARPITLRSPPKSVAGTPAGLGTVAVPASSIGEVGGEGVGHGAFTGYHAPCSKNIASEGKVGSIYHPGANNDREDMSRKHLTVPRVDSGTPQK